MRFLVGADVPPDPDSGAAGTVYQTNAALRSLGCEVDEVWAQDLGRRIRHGNLHYALELPRAYRRLVAQRLRSRSYDVVMLSQPHAYLTGEYIKRTYPKVLFLNRTHGWEGQFDEAMRKAYPDADRNVSFFKRAARQCMSAALDKHQHRVVAVADGIVSGSSEVADYLETKYKYPRRRVAILPHGVPDAFLAKPLNDAETGRWKKLLYVGQYSAFKAPHVVAEVFNRVLSNYPEVEAGWVCGHKDHERIRALVDQRNAGRLMLYPWMRQDELISLYDAHGLFVFPSFYEGFGKTPFEAMARGMTVISSRVGGMADLITSGKNGFLVDPGNSAQIVENVERLLGNPSLAFEMGWNARETASKLTWENLARGLVAFAEELKRG